MTILLTQSAYLNVFIVSLRSSSAGLMHAIMIVLDSLPTSESLRTLVRIESRKGMCLSPSQIDEMHLKPHQSEKESSPIGH